MSTARRPLLEMLLLALLVTGMCIRFTQLGTKEFWHDEAYSLFNAAGLTPYGQADAPVFVHADLEERNTLGGVFHACLLNDGGNGILHAVLMHGWLGMVPNRTAWLRLPSAILGLVVILLTMGMARDLFRDRPVVLLAGVFAAFNVLLLQGSIELRSYTLAAVLALSSTWCVFRILRQSNDRWSRRAYALFAVLGLLAHYSTAYVLLGHIVAALLLARDRRTWGVLALSGTLVLAIMVLWMRYDGAEGYAVLAARNAQYTAQAVADPQINTFFQAARPATLVEGVAVQALWSAGNGLQFAGPQLRWIMLMLALPAWLCLLAWRKCEERKERVLIVALAALAVMPMAYATVLAVSSGHTVPYFPRYALFSMPFWCILLAWGTFPRTSADQSMVWRTGPVAATLVLAIAVGSVVLFLHPGSRPIVGPDRYADQRDLIGGAIRATQRCAPELVHATHTSAYLVNTMAWNDGWGELQQRVEADTRSYTWVEATAPCTYPPISIIANNGLYPRSEPKDPTDDVTW